MKPDYKDKAKAAAAASAGAGVGGVGGATVGVLELAAQGVATALTAGFVIGFGAAAGGLAAYGVYRHFKKRSLPPAHEAPKERNPIASPAGAEGGRD